MELFNHCHCLLIKAFIDAREDPKYLGGCNRENEKIV